jgi:integral membrane protein (TIGR01906 family)
VLLFANLLTTKAYLEFSKGKYESHSQITFDHDYAIERIIGYLNYRYDDLFFGDGPDDNSILMRDTEISHMVDVKNLYTDLRIVGVASLLIGGSLMVVQYKKDPKELYITLKKLHYGPVLFILFIGSYILIDFNAAFTAFHKFFFTNDNWLLYSTDVLIMMLPESFWMVSGLLILFGFTVSLILIYIINEKILLKSLKKLC